ncbi:MAG: hypothetical protein ACI4J7_12070, partial [Ruminiclostridium sp.]
MREKEIFSPFVKGLAENFQTLRDVAESFANNENSSKDLLPCCFLFGAGLRNSQKRRNAPKNNHSKPVNVQQKRSPQANAVIKLQTGQAPSRLPGVKG